ncbi:MAG: DUF429 domain-containing protein [Gammaproteobacteria bacterium]|nr:DUF429 domain-containing protein [Gammaproteobacteria bacterium]
MKVLGIDFTSRPTRRKPITCCVCRLAGTRLHAELLVEWVDFTGFEQALARPGPWIAGADFPFGFARRFIKTIGWPADWQAYMRHVGDMSRADFRRALDHYRHGRAAGDKEHRRATDILAGAISPQKLYGTPVGLMLYEGVPRLLDAGVSIPGLHQGDPERIVVEAYPGLLARRLIGRRSYKSDDTGRQDAARGQAREDLLAALVGGDLAVSHNIAPVITDAVAGKLRNDAGGDRIDALLCAVQAAWSWTRRADNFGLPASIDPLEGWIVASQLR